MATHKLTAQGASGSFNYRGGESSFAFFGDFDGNYVKIQATFDEGENYIDLKKITDDVLAVGVNEVHNISLSGACQLRYNVFGGGAAPDITIIIA